MPTYLQPPIHEVILDIKFAQAIDDAALQGVPSILGGQWTPAAANKIELWPDGSVRNYAQSFANWSSEETDECRWVIRVWADRITMNSVRNGEWPTGAYVGWETIRQRWTALIQKLDDIFQSKPTRCGLRYVNKLALPTDLAADELLNIYLNAPDMLCGISNFTIRQTWSDIVGYEGLSASVALARLPNHPATGDDCIAAVLDIDIHNTSSEGAPALDVLMQWFDTAHRAENEVFEACLGEPLKARFMKAGA